MVDMSNQSGVVRFFSEVQETMRLKFRGWERDLPHQGEKGGIRERRVADFLKSILPSRYGIGTGHIIDSQKNAVISNQTDIVIYDALNGIALPIDNYYSLFPCECVYATIEVKSVLSASDGDSGPSGTIYECAQRTTRIKSLNRDGHGLDPIHSLVFAYETDWKDDQPNKIKEWFEHFSKTYSLNLPEAVFVLEPGFVLVGGSDPRGLNTSNEFTHIYSRDPLLFFASDLIHRLSETKVATPNLWREYIDWQEGEVIVSIYNR